jgi:4-diphosphocytidyl-2C-methyl-D-erythritol kinase
MERQGRTALLEAILGNFSGSGSSVFKTLDSNNDEEYTKVGFSSGYSSHATVTVAWVELPQYF